MDTSSVEQGKMHKHFSVVGLVIIFVLLLVTTVIMYGNAHPSTRGTPVSKTPIGKVAPPITKERTIAHTYDVQSKVMADRLPKGIPATFPVETGALTQSSRIEYVDQKATLYSVTYTSTKDITAIIASYLDFLKSGGYVVKNTMLNKETIQIEGKKKTDSVTVVLTSSAGKTQVVAALFLHTQ